jgi:thiosulfate/3-mercaptopyruvate sulfurtransferase
MAANSTTLINTAELQECLDAETRPVLLDCRFDLFDVNLGRRLFDDDHIPGAQYVDLNQDLSDAIKPGVTGRHPLPPRDVFMSTAAGWGISNDTRVIAYDADSGAYAARLWWMMRWLGHTNTAVLNGGFAAWRGEQRAVSQDRLHLPKGSLSQRLPITRQINAKQLLATDDAIIDARDRKRFSGENEPVDPIAGHIPGAICMPFTENMADGKFKSEAALLAQYGRAGISPEQTPICYCGSGVTATHHILALIHAGFPEPSLYPGSWSEWITQPEHPIETGD